MATSTIEKMVFNGNPKVAKALRFALKNHNVENEMVKIGGTVFDLSKMLEMKDGISNSGEVYPYYFRIAALSTEVASAMATYVNSLPVEKAKAEKVEKVTVEKVTAKKAKAEKAEKAEKVTAKKVTAKKAKKAKAEKVTPAVPAGHTVEKAEKVGTVRNVRIGEWLEMFDENGKSLDRWIAITGFTDTGRAQTKVVSAKPI